MSMTEDNLKNMELSAVETIILIEKELDKVEIIAQSFCSKKQHDIDIQIRGIISCLRELREAVLDDEY